MDISFWISAAAIVISIVAIVIDVRSFRRRM
jgi:hypothetical protein